MQKHLSTTRGVRRTILGNGMSKRDAASLSETEINCTNLIKMIESPLNWPTFCLEPDYFCNLRDYFQVFRSIHILGVKMFVLTPHNSLTKKHMVISFPM